MFNAKLKLSKVQEEKFQLINMYLKQREIYLDDNDATWIYRLQSCYSTGKSLFIYGSCWDNLTRKKKEMIVPTELTQIYRAALKGDEDFKQWVENFKEIKNQKAA